MLIKFNDKNISDLMYINNVKGLGIPSTKDISVDFMNTSGSYYTGSMLSERVVTIDCTMVQKKGENVYNKFDTLKGILNPFMGEQKLEFGKFPNRHLMARFSGELSEEVIGSMFRFSISFACSDPLFYSNNLESISTVKSKTYNLFNEGNVGSSALSINGVLNTGISNIINQTTGKSLRLNNDTGANKNINIDFMNASITSGPQNANNFYMSGEFFDLAPGINNIRIDMAGASYWRSAWI